MPQADPIECPPTPEEIQEMIDKQKKKEKSNE